METTQFRKKVHPPMDARLYDQARERLFVAADERDISLRQNYKRNSKELLLKQNRYTHVRRLSRSRRIWSF